jgi:hypothetical protein
MIDERTAAEQRSRTASAWRWQRAETPLSRFLGGTPANVALRLFFLSLVVGALLMWLDVRPAEIIQAVVHFVHRIWAMGFSALHELGNYLLAGAVIVIPIWLLLRLLDIRGPK